MYDLLQNNWQRVLFRLWEAKRIKASVYIPNTSKTFDPGFLPIWEFQSPYIGGSAGDVRLRELRNKRNVPIIMRKFKGANGKLYFVYKLGCLCSDIDWMKILSNKKWKYQYQADLINKLNEAGIRGTKAGEALRQKFNEVGQGELAF